MGAPLIFAFAVYVVDFPRRRGPASLRSPGHSAISSGPNPFRAELARHPRDAHPGGRLFLARPNKVKAIIHSERAFSSSRTTTYPLLFHYTAGPIAHDNGGHLQLRGPGIGIIGNTHFTMAI